MWSIVMVGMLEENMSVGEAWLELVGKASDSGRSCCKWLLPPVDD